MVELTANLFIIHYHANTFKAFSYNHLLSIAAAARLMSNFNEISVENKRRMVLK